MTCLWPHKCLFQELRRGRKFPNSVFSLLVLFLNTQDWGWGKFHGYLNSSLDLEMRSKVLKVESMKLLLWMKIWECFSETFFWRWLKLHHCVESHLKKSLLLFKQNTLHVQVKQWEKFIYAYFCISLYNNRNPILVKCFFSNLWATSSCFTRNGDCQFHSQCWEMGVVWYLCWWHHRAEYKNKRVITGRRVKIKENWDCLRI